MILMKILDRDLHKSKSNSAIPLMLETPCLPHFLPAVISNTKGQFIVSRKIKDNYLRSGVFQYDFNSLDDLINPLFNAAYQLSIEEKWPNIFKSIDKAYKYIKSNSHSKIQPHLCLTPLDCDLEKKFKRFNELEMKYGTSSIIKTTVNQIVFLSFPDMVGLYTQFFNSRFSILLHNVKKGIAFVES